VGFLRLPPEPLGARGLATLLLDFLKEEEAQDRTNVLDTPLLSERMVEATVWVRSGPDIQELRIGSFGAGTGVAAALVAVAKVPAYVWAVVSRGGHADMAKEALSKVKTPVLLIVGERDYQVPELNRAAARRLTCNRRVRIVPEASHLFEEPGTSEQAIDPAVPWFEAHLTSTGVRQ